jgi:hypothetical protein
MALQRRSGGVSTEAEPPAAGTLVHAADGLVGQLATLDDAASVAAALSQSTNALNEAIRKAESALAALNMGVSVCMLIDDEPDEDGKVTYLSFRRGSATWQFFIDLGPPLGDPSGVDLTEWKSDPLVTASRELRLLAANRLNDLVTALTVKAKQQLHDMQAGVLRAQAVVERLTGKVGR